jgi:hypothetical protein
VTDPELATVIGLERRVYDRESIVHHQGTPAA